MLPLASPLIAPHPNHGRATLIHASGCILSAFTPPCTPPQTTWRAVFIHRSGHIPFNLTPPCPPTQPLGGLPSSTHQGVFLNLLPHLIPHTLRTPLMAAAEGRNGSTYSRWLLTDFAGTATLFLWGQVRCVGGGVVVHTAFLHGEGGGACMGRACRVPFGSAYSRWLLTDFAGCSCGSRREKLMS